jgi:membrane protein insertase Oxa1/YidC/SpoIIIJ
MAFYKKNGHNPLGGCLPMLLQIPVFFALWSMLNAVYDLRHAPWIFWIKERAALMNWPSLIGTLVLSAEITSLRTRSESKIFSREAPSALSVLDVMKMIRFVEATCLASLAGAWQPAAAPSRIARKIECMRAP